MPENYWEGTGSDEAIKEFLGFLMSEDADRMQVLVDGGVIDITINDKLTYSDFARHRSADFWTLLLFAGYLTVVKRLPRADSYQVRIPNEEVLNTFVKNVKERFSDADAGFAAHGEKIRGSGALR